MVSIITTTKNRKDFLEKLIKNLLEQDYKNIEHIVIDAASTDGTQAMLKFYEGKYNLKWISESDRMQTEGVNKGLRLATGDLVTITHDDDGWLADGLNILVAEFERDKDLVLVYGDSYSLFTDGRREPTRYRRYSLSDMVNGGYQIPQHCCVFRRDYLKKVGWLDENIEHVAEYELFLRIIKGLLPSTPFDDFSSTFDNEPREKSEGILEKSSRTFFARRIECGEKGQKMVLGSRPMVGGKYKYIPKFVGVGFQHENKASWKCWNHSWDETWAVNRKHGGRLFSKFTLIYIKNRYFKNLGEWLRRRFPKYYERAKKIFKVPLY